MTESPDPAAAVRAMLDQWLTLSAAVAERTFAPAGPGPDAVTRADFAALDARLARIEALLVALAGATINRGTDAAARAFTPDPSRSTTMAELNIPEHANIIGADGVHVGTVDHVDGDRIKLTKTDSTNQHHHWISRGLIAEVHGNEVRLSANAAVAVTFEEDH